MLTHKSRLDTLGNNIANVNTPGFKQLRAEFNDLPYERMPNSQVNAAPGVELRMGSGADLVSTQRMFLQGNVLPTSSPTDFAIYGDGFFPVQGPDGSTSYTRNGNFQVDATGQLITAAGHRLVPPIQLPPDVQKISIGPNGQVEMTVAGALTPTVVGQLQLARFANPTGLIATGDGLLRPTEASGPADTAPAGSLGFGQVLTGSLEQSTVELAEEMTQLVLAQRAYQFSSKAFQTLDQMVGRLTEFRR